MRGYGVFSAFILVSSTVLGGPANSQAFDAIPAATSSAVRVNNELGQVQETAASCAFERIVRRYFDVTGGRPDDHGLLDLWRQLYK
jgi:hypothetical protein